MLKLEFNVIIFQFIFILLNFSASNARGIEKKQNVIFQLCTK